MYQDRLNALGISSSENPHYVKWVRYFLDFEAKYGVGEPRPKVVASFMTKLASKEQSPSLREQARKAIRIYRDLGAPEAALVASPPKASPQAATASWGIVWSERR